MSATIPETMLLSDLLKSTGYDCPEAAVGKTVSEIVSGGGDVELEDNKAATISVANYTAPVEVIPTSGKDGMKKATITLTNIPEPKTEIDLDATSNGEYTPDAGKVYKKVTVAVPMSVGLSAWKADTAIVYTKTTEPTTSDKALVPASTGITEGVIASVAEEFASITIGETTYTRYSDGDLTL